MPSPPPASLEALALVADRQAYFEALRALEAPLPDPPGPHLQRDSALAEVQQRLGQLDPPFREHPQVAELVREVGQARKKIATQVAKEQKAVDEIVALAERCGDKPGWSFHGGLVIVDLYMQQTAHDPDSIQSEQCTDPVLTDRCWRSSCLVRGRNVFGALVANQYTFYIGADSISVE
jgi:hypothetical protein